MSEQKVAELECTRKPHPIFSHAEVPQCRPDLAMSRNIYIEHFCPLCGGRIVGPAVPAHSPEGE